MQHLFINIIVTVNVKGQPKIETVPENCLTCCGKLVNRTSDKFLFTATHPANQLWTELSAYFLRVREKICLPT